MEFKILTQMKLSYESKQNFMELTEHETQLLAEINQALQLLQANVVGRSEQLPCPECGQLKPCAYNSPETCFHPEVYPQGN